MPLCRLAVTNNPAGAAKWVAKCWSSIRKRRRWTLDASPKRITANPSNYLRRLFWLATKPTPNAFGVLRRKRRTATWLQRFWNSPHLARIRRLVEASSQLGVGASQPDAERETEKGERHQQK